ncbi:hypothetical protein V1508DRAFT_397044 [Lipomyces doorenjongii]|uniref:uncharacterized protein n=1 Tax=Lipomyces doorenjongii TaxID=383834 RepID=UPI0034CFA8B5
MAVFKFTGQIGLRIVQAVLSFIVLGLSAHTVTWAIGGAPLEQPCLDRFRAQVIVANTLACAILAWRPLRYQRSHGASFVATSTIMGIDIFGRPGSGRKHDIDQAVENAESDAE